MKDLAEHLKLRSLRDQILSLTHENANVLLKKKPSTPGEHLVPISGKVLTSHYFSAPVDSSLDAWLAAGRFTSDFQRWLTQFVGARSALFVTRGMGVDLPKVGDRTNIDIIMIRSFRLGVYPGLRIPMLDYVIESITGFMSGKVK